MVAFSSGNHAQAVALASRELGIRATIVMPLDAPASKVAATRGYGANVVLYDRVGGEDREAIARYGVNIRDVQDVIEIAVGGENLTTSVEGRERLPFPGSEAARALATRVAVLHAGRLVAQGPSEAILASDAAALALFRADRGNAA